MSDQASLTDPPRRKKGGRVARWCGLLLVLLFAAFAGGAFWVKEREFVAPTWARDALSAKLDMAMPDLRVEFGDIVGTVDEAWRPRVLVRDVEIKSTNGEPVVSFDTVRIGVHLAALIERRVSLTQLYVNGVVLSLRRTPDGAVALQADEEASAASGQASNLIELVNELDEWLLRPGLSNLQEVDVRAVTLRYEDQRAKRNWTVDGGRVRLTREADDLQIAADLALLGGVSQVATLSANYSGEIGGQIADFGLAIQDLDARDIASQGVAFAWLGALRAPISGAVRGGRLEDGSFAPLNATLEIGAGVIQPTSEAAPIPIESAKSYFTYDPVDSALRFDQFSVNTAWGQGHLEGEAHFDRASTGAFEHLVGQFRLSDVQANPAGLYKDARNVEGAELDFRLSLDPFRVELGRVDLFDQGEVLSARGEISAGASGWDVMLDARMDMLAPARLLSFWPESMKVKTRTWISENVLDGVVRDANFSMRGAQGVKPEVSFGFDFQDGTFRFLKTMPFLKQARGHASMLRNRFSIVLDEGYVEAPQGGRVDAAGTAFIVPDTSAKPDTPGVVRLAARGSVTSALSLLDLPPLEAMKKAGRTVDDATGETRVSGTIAMPLRKGTQPDQIEFDVLGEVLDAQSETLVPDRLLTAERLLLQASERQVRLSGAARLSNVPVDVVWTQPLARGGAPIPGRVTGDLVLSEPALEAFNIALPPGSLSGEADARFAVDITKGAPPVLSLRSDLDGATLSIPPIQWRKPAEVPATLDLGVTLGEVPRVDRLLLDAPGLYAAGSLSLTPDGQVERVRLNDTRVGSWLNAPVDLVGRGAGQGPGVVVRGGMIDLRRAQFGDSGGAGGPLTVALDRLQVTDTVALTGLQGKFTTSGGLNGEFSGSVNGAAAVSGRVTPRAGRSAVRLTAPDAGRVVQAAGLVQRARAGPLALDLIPVGTDGAFDGKLMVRDVRITNAPAMAALLNGISVVGLINELNGDGIYFSDVSADFRLAPSRITLRQASAVGASMGLSMDGVFVPDSGQIAMQGVISPVYALNAVGSGLTRRGEGLFGFNYSITGTAQDPQVFVNPLTALAPGGLRNLFRSAQPQVPLEAGEAAPPPPKPRRKPVVTRGEDR